MSQPTHSSRILSEATLLASAPAAAYAIAFAYAAGYASYFGIPLILISVSLENFMLAAVALITALGGLFFIFNGLLMFIPTRYRRLDLFGNYLFLFIYLVLIDASLGWDRKTILWTAGGFIFLAVLFLVTPIFGKRGTYIERLEASERAEDLARARLTVGIIQARLGTGLVWILLTAVATLTISYNVGVTNARTQELFLTQLTNPKFVALARYGDNVVWAQIVGNNHVRQTFVVKSNSASPLATVEKIGPLVTDPPAP